MAVGQGEIPNFFESRNAIRLLLALGIALGGGVPASILVANAIKNAQNKQPSSEIIPSISTRPARTFTPTKTPFSTVTASRTPTAEATPKPIIIDINQWPLKKATNSNDMMGIEHRSFVSTGDSAQKDLNDFLSGRKMLSDPTGKFDPFEATFGWIQGTGTSNPEYDLLFEFGPEEAAYYQMLAEKYNIAFAIIPMPDPALYSQGADSPIYVDATEMSQDGKPGNSTIVPAVGIFIWPSNSELEGGYYETNDELSFKVGQVKIIARSMEDLQDEAGTTLLWQTGVEKPLTYSNPK